MPVSPEPKKAFLNSKPLTMTQVQGRSFAGKIDPSYDGLLSE
jgi:hypothetical protein